MVTAGGFASGEIPTPDLNTTARRTFPESLP
jgi:hypothetical protein